MQARNPAAALVKYREAFALCPDSPVVLFNMGNALEDIGNTKEAESFYLAAISQGSLDALFNLGRFYMLRGDTGHARHWYREYIREGPEDAYKTLARQYVGRFDPFIAWRNDAPNRTPERAPLELVK